LVFIPAASQPLKAGLTEATAAQRLAMTRRLVEGDPRFEVDSIEIDRGGLSYTGDTLAELGGPWAGAARVWLGGGGRARTVAQGRAPERVAAVATIVVMVRAGDAANLAAIPGAPKSLETRRIDISSTEVRRRVREGKSIRGFVPDAVAAFIAAERLYQ